MKKIILFLSITLILACSTSKSEREVVLFNDITFKLNDGEEIINIDSNKKDIFHSYLAKTAIQIPLFKCIKADNYLLFLGIPINTSIKELADYNLANTKKQAFFESDSTNYFYISHQTEEYSNTVYSKVFDNNLVYILSLSNSVELSNTLFSKNLLEKRFNK